MQRINIPGYSYAGNKIVSTFNFICSVLDAVHIEVRLTKNLKFSPKIDIEHKAIITITAGEN
jgi:hypothetical protein